MTNLIYLVIDVETDGPSIKQNSMFAIGGIAILPFEKKILGGFAFNIPEDPDTKPSDDTMNEFWLKQEQKPMYDNLHEKQVNRDVAAKQIATFVQELKRTYPEHSVMFASDCAVFDWKFIDDLLQEHVGNYVLGYSGMDIYSYISGAAKCPRNGVWKFIEKLKKDGCVWKDETVHDHNPYNDALNEAVLLADVMRWQYDMEWMPLDIKSREIPTNSCWYLLEFSKI